MREAVPTQIKFGTSGWRAVVADEFTLPNIRRAVIGIARYVAKQSGNRRILVGRDPCFMGEIFVEEATRLLTLGEQLQALFAKVGSYFPVRENFHLTAEAKDKFTEKLKTDPKELARRKVASVVHTDG